MQFTRPLDIVPIWGVFVLGAVIVLAAIECGYRIGFSRRKQSTDELEAPVGNIVGAALALLGLLLAFTFSMAADRFELRRKMVVEESNSIGTTYLRTSFLPDASRERVRGLLRDYVDARIEAIQTREFEQVLRRSAEIHQQLWTEAETAGREQPNSIVVGLFVDALNRTIDLHSERVMVGLHNRLPDHLWTTLGLVTVLTMGGVGYHEGLSRSRRSLASGVLVAAFASMLSLIADFDRPLDGMLRVSQKPMIELRASMDERP